MQQTFALINGQTIQPQLPFYAKSALVDNLGGQWLFFQDANRWVGPYTSGATIQLPATTNPLVTANKTPTGQTASGTGQAATVIFSDEEAQYNPGVPSEPTLNVNSVAVIASAFNINAAGSTQSAQFVLGLQPNTAYDCVGYSVALITVTAQAAISYIYTAAINSTLIDSGSGFPTISSDSKRSMETRPVRIPPAASYTATFTFTSNGALWSSSSHIGIASVFMQQATV